MSLEDIRNAAEKDQQAAIENEAMLAESVVTGEPENGTEASQQPAGENRDPAEATPGEGSHPHHDNNVVDMQGKPLADGEDKAPTRKMVKYVSGLSRQLNLDTPEGYEKSFKACRSFLDQHAYVIGEYKKQRQAAKKGANGRPGNESQSNAQNSGEQAGADDIAGSQMDAQTQIGAVPGNQQPQPPTGQASGVGAAVGAIAGLGAGILGLSGSVVKFPVKAGKLGLQTFRNANMQNALEDAHEAAGHFTETVNQLVSGNATQDDVKAAYSEFQKHYKHTLNSIDRVGMDALEKTPERLSEVRQKLSAISERVEVGGIKKLEEDSRFKELGNNLRDAFENFFKFFEKLFNRILGRSSAAPSMG